MFLVLAAAGHTFALEKAMPWRERQKLLLDLLHRLRGGPGPSPGA